MSVKPGFLDGRARPVPGGGTAKKSLTVLIAVLAVFVVARAHRLDEYLQATRVAVSIKVVELRMDLTPGVAILRELLPVMDRNGDGRISTQEQDAYGDRLVHDLHFELDGQPQQLKLQRISFPARTDLESGEGVIHLTVHTGLGELNPGRHKLYFRNDHLPEISVYLVNALVPNEKQIRLGQQQRDQLQREYRLEFEVTP